MRLIFIPVADRPECARALRVAFNLGQKLGASLCGCHIRPHGRSEVSLQTAFGSFGNDDSAWENAWKGKKTQKSAASARGLFSRMAESQHYELIKSPRSTPGAVWQEKSGSPDKLLSISGPVADLIIVSRAPKKGGKIANLFMQAALLNTGRPVLMLPQSGVPEVGKRISIAWNQSTEAAQAVAAAMPLLQLAEQVTIITSGSDNELGPKASQLATYLRFWGVKTERVRTRDGDDAKALIKAHKAAKSDLLVMGAYSRSRLRQRIFGGVTEFMLSRADIPVLMLHR
jgi:nucleotide-binding universal stress UspA family protein